MIIDEPKHYQKHATTRNPYIVLFGFVTVAEQTRFENRDNDIDLNTIETDSWIFIGTDNPNRPDGTSKELAFVYTKYVGIYGSARYIIQWYYGWNAGSNYIRKKHTGKWQSWEKF